MAAEESQRHFFISYLEDQPEFDRVSGDLWVYRDNNRFYDLFVSIENGKPAFFGGFEGEWFREGVLVPGWVRRRLS